MESFSPFLYFALFLYMIFYVSLSGAASFAAIPPEFEANPMPEFMNDRI